MPRELVPVLALTLLVAVPAVRAQALVAVGAQFLVNTRSTNNQGRPAVAVDADRNFVVARHSYGSDHDDTFSRRVASDDGGCVNEPSRRILRDFPFPSVEKGGGGI